MKKKQHSMFALILVVLISLAMIGSGFAVFFSGAGGASPNTGTANNAANLAADYQTKKASIATMVEQAKKDPGNVPLQTALGNAYYDAGVASQAVAPTETQENFKQAVVAYQIVLKTNKDPNVMVDMATAAFNSGDNALAEKSYKEALVLKPDFYNGLANYGIFLANVKSDLPGAIIQWQKAEAVAQTTTDKDQVQSFISQAQSQLSSGASNPPTNGMSNPALKNGATSPAPTGK